MAFKILAGITVIIAIQANVISAQYSAGTLFHAALAQPSLLEKSTDEYDSHPKYSYGYDVQDALSGDSKSQNEERDGDVVRGQYSLNDADGYKRTVQYTADPINGFNAVVHREPLVQAVVKSTPIAYQAAPIAYHHAPAQTYIKSPISYVSHY